MSISGIASVVENPADPYVDVQADGRSFRMLVRLDTRRDVDYYCNGGVLPYVLRALLDRD